MDSHNVLRPRISKSCDECKSRKVRCIRSRPDAVNCDNCIKRKHTCHFSNTKRKLKVKSPEELSSRSTSLPLTHSTDEANLVDISFQQNQSSQKLYIDYILENRNAHGISNWKNDASMLKTGESFVTSSSLAMFSESRIRSLTERIGHDRLRELIEAISYIINSKMNRVTNAQRIELRSNLITFRGPTTPEEVAPEAARTYIEAYFKNIHPMYPFLDRREFEQKVYGYDLAQLLSSNAAFSALYHTVLALGFQYVEGGTFEPGKGKAWKLYQVALGLFSDILLPRESLVNLQALTAMAIFAKNLACIQIDSTMVTEAARMSQSLGYNRLTNDDATHKTFWVIYILEKTLCFCHSTGSSLSDPDIGCPIPEIPEAVYGGADWFLVSARLSRLMSRTYEMLFTVSATMRTPEQFYEDIDAVWRDLETWRLSVPKDLRPGDQFQPESCKNSWTITVSIKLHFLFFAVVISLCRLTIHLSAGTQSTRANEAKIKLMHTARRAIEITNYIDMQPYTPTWILGVAPLSALFILFDFVVHNPFHPETSVNLAMLDVAASYFSRLEYATGGSLQSSVVTEFAIIARQFLQDIHSGKRQYGAPATGDKSFSTSIERYNGVQEIQPMTYPHTQMAPIVTLAEQEQQRQQPIDNGSLPYGGQLFYPTTDMQSLLTDLSAGFDISGLFDSLLPNYQL